MCIHQREIYLLTGIIICTLHHMNILARLTNLILLNMRVIFIDSIFRCYLIVLFITTSERLCSGTWQIRTELIECLWLRLQFSERRNNLNTVITADTVKANMNMCQRILSIVDRKYKIITTDRWIGKTFRQLASNRDWFDKQVCRRSYKWLSELKIDMPGDEKKRCKICTNIKVRVLFLFHGYISI